MIDTVHHPIKLFYALSFLDWPGLLSSVVFLPHCNLRCPYCHNPELVLGGDELTDVEFSHIKSSLMAMAVWLDGVVITGGEPTLYPNLISLIHEFKERGLKVKLDTNGTRPDVLEELLEKQMVDCIAMDIKAPPNDEILYKKCCGMDVDIENICHSIKIIMASDRDYIFRTTVVPSFLTIESVVEIAKCISGARKLVLQNFRPGKLIDSSLNRLKPFSFEELEQFRDTVSLYVEKCEITFNR